MHPIYTWSGNDVCSPRSTSFINFFHIGVMSHPSSTIHVYRQEQSLFPIVTVLVVPFKATSVSPCTGLVASSKTTSATPWSRCSRPRQPELLVNVHVVAVWVHLKWKLGHSKVHGRVRCEGHWRGWFSGHHEGANLDQFCCHQHCVSAITSGH